MAYLINTGWRRAPHLGGVSQHGQHQRGGAGEIGAGAGELEPGAGVGAGA